MSIDLSSGSDATRSSGAWSSSQAVDNIPPQLDHELKTLPNYSVFFPDIPKPDDRVDLRKGATWSECHRSLDQHFRWVYMFMRLNYLLVDTRDIQEFNSIRDQFIQTRDNPPPQVTKPSLKEKLAQRILGKNPAHPVVRQHEMRVNDFIDDLQVCSNSNEPRFY
ncbi:hypothetical protein FRB99_006665 [Tulasnella sp. 403]|nr:hypothetical protein FRB99_006665 [Tulasnella sp. 403]